MSRFRSSDSTKRHVFLQKMRVCAYDDPTRIGPGRFLLKNCWDTQKNPNLGRVNSWILRRVYSHNKKNMAVDKCEFKRNIAKTIYGNGGCWSYATMQLQQKTHLRWPVASGGLPLLILPHLFHRSPSPTNMYVCFFKGRSSSNLLLTKHLVLGGLRKC